MTINLNKKTLGYLVAFLALVALVLWGCLDAFGFKVVSDGLLGKTESVTNYTGFRVFFGITEKTEMWGQTLITEVSGFNWMSLVTYLLGLVGIFCILAGKKLSKVGVVALLLTTVLIFLSPVFASWFFTDDFKESIKNLEELKSEFDVILATPAIISGVILALSSLIGAFSLTLKK